MDVKNSDFVKQIVEDFSCNPEEWHNNMQKFLLLINSEKFELFDRVDYIASIIYELDDFQFHELQNFFGLFENNGESTFNMFTLWVEDATKIKLDPKNLRKFEEHIKLSCHQRNFIIKNGLEAQEIANEARDVVDEVSEIKGKIYSEFIAILGIFTAVSFLAMGSLQVLGDLFKGVGDPTSENFGFALVIGGIYILIIYTFLMTMFIGMRKVIGNNSSYQFTWGFCLFILIVCSVLISIGLFVLNYTLPAIIILTVGMTGLVVLLINALSKRKTSC